MEDAGTSEEDDIDSQDSNTPIDHGHLAWNCSIKIITPAVKASVISMSHHRCFITHGSRLNTGCTFPVSLMEAMLRFMEHKVKKCQFSVFVAIGYIYRFVLVQQL